MSCAPSLPPRRAAHLASQKMCMNRLTCWPRAPPCRSPHRHPGELPPSGSHMLCIGGSSICRPYTLRPGPAASGKLPSLTPTSCVLEAAALVRDSGLMSGLQHPHCPPGELTPSGSHSCSPFSDCCSPANDTAWLAAAAAAEGAAARGAAAAGVAAAGGAAAAVMASASALPCRSPNCAPGELPRRGSHSCSPFSDC